MPSLSVYEQALALAKDYETNQWQIGEFLAYAVDFEGKTIRQFCLDATGGVEKEDTFARYMKAARFKADTFMQPHDPYAGLEITYYSEAWMWLQSEDADIEDVLDTLVEAKDFKRGIRWFRARKAEATGKTMPISKRLSDLLSTHQVLVDKYNAMYPLLLGLCSSMDAELARLARAVIVAGEEITELSTEPLTELVELLKEAENKDENA